QACGGEAFLRVGPVVSFRQSGSLAINNIAGGFAMKFSLWTLLFLVFAALAPASAQQGPTVGANEIGGVVAGPSGPEAGVWVIAETSDLPTKYAKIVVTDDQGRYLIPDLPKANYDVWVRGYGLVDSHKVKSEPGKTLNLTAVKAPTEKDAAKYYPAI